MSGEVQIDNKLKKSRIIHIDARMLYSSGIGRCLREILKEILKIEKDLNIYLYCSFKDYSKYLSEYGLASDRLIFKKYESPIYSISEQFAGSLINLKLKENEIFYCPHYNLPFIIHGNTTVTIHDFIQFKFPEYFGRAKARIAWQILRNSVKKTKKVIVVSKATLEDFSRFFPDFKFKARVIYNGISEKFKVLKDSQKREFMEKNKLGRYILFIGNNKPHKNISGLVNSFNILKKEFDDLRLVIISKGFKIDNLSLKTDLDSTGSVTADYSIDKSVAKDIIIIDELNDDELVYYYNCASILAMPSYYEGFGLPVIEAMACGCPVVASNVSSLYEVGKEAAILVDPYDINSLTNGLKKLLEDDALRKDFIKKGLERASLFSWEKTAKNYLELFLED